jgi:hypothetical protein
MSVVLLILGIVLTAAGIAAIGFAIPLNDFTLSTALYTTGTTALTGGVIVIALSVVVAELGRVAEGLKNRSPTRSNAAARQGAESQEPVIAPVAQPAMLNQPVIQPAAAPPLPPGPMIAPPAPAVANGLRAPAQSSVTARPDAPSRQPHPAEAYPPPAPSAVEVSAAAIERLRSSIPRTERPRAEPDMDEAPLSPNGAMHHPGPGGPQPRPPEAAPNEPRIAAEDRNGDPAVEALKASRLDFLFRSKPAARPAPQQQPQQQPENFDAYWPADARQQQPGRAAPAEPRQRTDQVERQPTYAPPPEPLPQAQAHAPAPAHEPALPAILKSGVVDGMAYTLYADGSIEAKLPHGTVRFGSIAELRAHIESNS